MANIPFNRDVTQFVGSGIGQPTAGYSPFGMQGGQTSQGPSNMDFASMLSKMMPQAGQQQGMQMPQMPSGGIGGGTPPPWLSGGAQVPTSPLISQHNSFNPMIRSGQPMMSGIFGAK